MEILSLRIQLILCEFMMPISQTTELTELFIYKLQVALSSMLDPWLLIPHLAGQLPENGVAIAMHKWDVQRSKKYFVLQGILVQRHFETIRAWLKSLPFPSACERVGRPPQTQVFAYSTPTSLRRQNSLENLLPPPQTHQTNHP